MLVLFLPVLYILNRRIFSRDDGMGCIKLESGSSTAELFDSSGSARPISSRVLTIPRANRYCTGIRYRRPRVRAGRYRSQYVLGRRRNRHGVANLRRIFLNETCALVENKQIVHFCKSKGAVIALFLHWKHKVINSRCRQRYGVSNSYVEWMELTPNRNNFNIKLFHVNKYLED